MKRTITWNIPPSLAGITLEQFLRMQGLSHHVLTHLKKTEGGILQNGVRTYTNQRLSAGDKVTIHVLENESSSRILPVDIPIHIVYEDEDLMVLNKPADMPIHPSVNQHENTLANGVMHYFASRNIPFVYRCVNRLDRDTSGLLIIAKNMVSAAILFTMSAQRRIRREYLAITEGLLPESVTIRAPIARLEGSALMRCVDEEKGESAVTHFRRLLPEAAGSRAALCQSEPVKTAAALSLASVHLETGRTHQIRVHMQHIGHPLIGDFLYNPGSDSLIKRQALHSHRLQFTHPITGKAMDFSCPLPEDMQRVLDHSF